MKFSNNYFEDEVRDGFFVPSEIKRAWAAELEVLSEIDKICKKHNIQYFADWGTLLATVRHEGFIPWDDDLDIVMKREDYRRFMEIAQTELPEGFSAYNFRNHDNLWLFLGRVVGKRRICFEEEHLERFHQFPYIAGVDIFVLDYVSRDKEAEQKRDELALHTIALADMIGEGKGNAAVIEQELKNLEQICKIHIPRGLSNIEMRRELYGVVELLFGWFKEEEADELTQLFPFGLKPGGFRVSKKCYEQALELPYENMRIPVPIQYCEMLERKYGDYMRLVRDSGGHDYPFFEAQKKQLQAVMDFPMPEYKFAEEQLTCEKDGNGYKISLQKMMKRLGAALPEYEEMQQMAIDMGTLIEQVRGEGTHMVGLLEELCENIYECSVATGQSQDISEKLSHLQDKITQVTAALQTEILNRRESVLVVYKADQWKYAEWFWKSEMERADTDVYVLVVPYYYKKYDGTCYATQYEPDEIRECVSTSHAQLREQGAVAGNCQVIEYDRFDLMLHHPDEIMIQNPYDEWNQTITLPGKYYSRNLQRYTDELVYAPPFELEEFSKNNYREYHNMQYYCTMPGVIRADKVYVQSENMRNVYIGKLTEFAGASTVEIWEQKIAVAPKEICDLEKLAASEENRRKNRIAFWVQVGLTIQYKDEMLKKMEAVIQTFADNKDTVELLWIGDAEHDAFLNRYDSRFAQEYDRIRTHFINGGLGRYIDRKDASVAEIVAMCDAYYGSASHIALEFEVEKKPVMIMSVEVR